MTDSPEEIPKRRCFVLSPIGDAESTIRKQADSVLKHLIRKALHASDLVINRGDEEANPGAISPQLVQSILSSDVIIADMSGFNPNVFYEIAIAHGYGIPIVHIQIATESPAFDVQDMRIVRYRLDDPEALELAQVQLKSFVDFALEHPAECKTPLSEAQQFQRQLDSVLGGDPAAASLALIWEEMREIRKLVKDRHTFARPLPDDQRRELVADRTALKRIVDNVAEDGQLSVEHIMGSISTSTSTGFDKWIRNTLATISGIEVTDGMVETVLYDEEMTMDTEESLFRVDLRGPPAVD